MSLTPFMLGRRGRTPNRRRGVTLIEVVLAVAVGAVAIIAVIGFYITASGSSKQNQASQQLQQLVSQTRTLYAGRADYTDLDNELAISTKVMPADMVADVDTAYNPWGGEVTVEEGTSSTNFDVTYENVPQDACTKLLTLNAAGLGGAAVEIDVNGTSFTGANLDISPSDANTACDSADANTIVWTLR